MEVSGHHYDPVTLPLETFPVPIEQEAEWAPDPVQMF